MNVLQFDLRVSSFLIVFLSFCIIHSLSFLASRGPLPLIIDIWLIIYFWTIANIELFLLIVEILATIKYSKAIVLSRINGNCKLISVVRLPLFFNCVLWQTISLQQLVAKITEVVVVKVKPVTILSPLSPLLSPSASCADNNQLLL